MAKKETEGKTYRSINMGDGYTISYYLENEKLFGVLHFMGKLVSDSMDFVTADNIPELKKKLKEPMIDFIKETSLKSMREFIGKDKEAKKKRWRFVKKYLLANKLRYWTVVDVRKVVLETGNYIMPTVESFKGIHSKDGFYTYKEYQTWKEAVRLLTRLFIKHLKSFGYSVDSNTNNTKYFDKLPDDAKGYNHFLIRGSISPTERDLEYIRSMRVKLGNATNAGKDLRTLKDTNSDLHKDVLEFADLKSKLHTKFEDDLKELDFDEIERKLINKIKNEIDKTIDIERTMVVEDYGKYPKKPYTLLDDDSLYENILKSKGK